MELGCVMGTRTLQHQVAETKETRMQSLWTLAGLGTLAAIMVPFWWSIGRGRHDDLGSVSQRWLAEHRYSQSHAERR